MRGSGAWALAADGCLEVGEEEEDGGGHGRSDGGPPARSYLAGRLPCDLSAQQTCQSVQESDRSDPQAGWTSLPCMGISWAWPFSRTPCGALGFSDALVGLDSMYRSVSARALPLWIASSR